MIIKHGDITRKIGRIGYIFRNHGIGCYPKIINLDNVESALPITAEVALELGTPFVLIVTRKKGKPAWSFMAIEYAITGTAPNREVKMVDVWPIACGSMTHVYKTICAIGEFTGILLKRQEESE